MRMKHYFSNNFGVLKYNLTQNQSKIESSLSRQTALLSSLVPSSTTTGITLIGIWYKGDHIRWRAR